jgi:hypothetical protein
MAHEGVQTATPDKEARALARALTLLVSPRAVLAQIAGERFAVFPNGDRRQRPQGKVSGTQLAALLADGAVAVRGDVYVITAAGRARTTRQSALERAAAYVAQHGGLVSREVMDHAGDVAPVQARPLSDLRARLERLKTPDGAPFFSRGELALADRLRGDADLAAVGVTRGVDWSAPPKGTTARGPGAGPEASLAAVLDARRRLDQSLARLAPPQRELVRLVVLQEERLEVAERRLGWPARSGKLALKLALAQLCA